MHARLNVHLVGSLQAKRGEPVKATLSPVWDTMVEIPVADYTQVRCCLNQFEPVLLALM